MELLNHLYSSRGVLDVIDTNLATREDDEVIVFRFNVLQET